MNNTTQAFYNRKLREIASDYEKRGYTVLIGPSSNDLPAFLADYHPDLVAVGPQDSVVVELKIGTQTSAIGRFKELAETIQRQPGWRFSLVVVDTRSDDVAPSADQLLNRSEISERLEKADHLINAGTTDAAFLLIWSSIEALLRHIATQEVLPLERMPSSALTKELYSMGLLSRSDFEFIQRAFTIRNSIVHGFEDTDLNLIILEELKQLAHRLQRELGQNVKQNR